MTAKQTNQTVTYVKKRSLWQKIVANKALLLFLVPGLIVMLINNYLPMFGLSMAFKNMDNSLGMFKSPWVGFENFEFLFKSKDLWLSVRNTLLYNVFFIIASVPLNAGLAILLTEMCNRHAAKLYQTIFCVPYFISIIVVAAITNAFLSTRSGVLNNIIEAIGLDPVNWYSTPDPWPIILIIVYYWQQCGYGAIIYIATITGFDPQIFEAATVDGANRFQKIFYITVPMLKQTAVVMTILALGGILNGHFGLFYQVPMNSPMLYPVTDTLGTYIYRSLTTVPDIGMTTAVSLLTSVVSCILVVSVNLIVRHWDPDSALF